MLVDKLISGNLTWLRNFLSNLDKYDSMIILSEQQNDKSGAIRFWSIDIWSLNERAEVRQGARNVYKQVRYMNK